MNEPTSPRGEESNNEGLRIRPLHEVLPLVEAQMENTRQALGVPTRAELEDSDPRLPTIVCSPSLEAEEMEAKTSEAQAILLVAFASGALPDRLTPVIQKRIQQGIPVIVISDNPADNHGIIRLKYAAGSDVYDAGAFPLQKVNVMQHRDVKAAICRALDEGKRGQELVDYLDDLYSYKEGEEVPKAEWETPEGVDKMRTLYRQTLKRTGMTEDEIAAELQRWEFGEEG